MGSAIGCSSACCSNGTTEPQTKAETVQAMSPLVAGTVFIAEFPTMCLPMQRFMMLESMQTHEALLGNLVEPDGDATVHFISHEWLGFTHPDPDRKQLSKMQRIFRVFLDCRAHELFDAEDWDAFLAGVSAGSSNALRVVEGSVVNRDRLTDEDLVQHVKNGYVWLDYHSIPQASKDERFMRAVNSIPYYVERCNYFWICAPCAMHRELQEPRDFLSWRRRGWCRLEEMMRFLSGTAKMPLIVTNQPKVATYGFFDGLALYFGRPERSVFNGSFTCCQLNHRLKQADGSFVDISCDKDAIGLVLRRAFNTFFNMPSKEQQFRTNTLRYVARYIFVGYALEEARWTPKATETVEQYLARTGFQSLDDLDGLGFGPMGWALNLADVNVAKAIHVMRPDLLPLRSKVGNMSVIYWSLFAETSVFQELLSLFNPATLPAELNLRSEAGHLPLEQAAKFGFAANAALMIEAKAEVDARRTDNRATPLLSAAQQGYAECCQTLLAHRADVHAADASGRTALHFAVGPLAVLGNPEAGGKLQVVETLLKATASVNVADSSGRTPLQVAQELEFHDGVALLSQYK